MWPLLSTQNGCLSNPLPVFFFSLRHFSSFLSPFRVLFGRLRRLVVFTQCTFVLFPLLLQILSASINSEIEGRLYNFSFKAIVT